MRLFSKRHKSSEFEARRKSLISDELRNRIISEILFLSWRDDFLEYFVLFDNQKKDKKFLDSNKVDWFSVAELGYKLSEYFEFEDFYMKIQESPEGWIMRRNEKWEFVRDERQIKYYNDYKLFDLLEFLILFSKKEKREEVIDRFNNILIEEWSEYEIVNWMIAKKSWEWLWTILTALKDSDLRKKLEDYSYFKTRGDYIGCAKTWIEILNIIFSNEDEDKKKEEILKILNLIAEKSTSTPQEKEDLIKLMNANLKNLDSFSNQIYNVRHTEKSTIHIKQWSWIIYKMISEQSMSIIELIIIILREEFTSSEDWEKIKETYIQKYQINRNLRLAIKTPKEPEIRLEDLPF